MREYGISSTTAEQADLGYPHAQTPPTHKEKGLAMTINHFLVCAKSAVSILNQPDLLMQNSQLLLTWQNQGSAQPVVRPGVFG